MTWRVVRSDSPCEAGGARGTDATLVHPPQPERDLKPAVLLAELKRRKVLRVAAAYGLPNGR